MLISVIVPVYNVEKYLRQCLDSLLQQSYRDLEIIMVDDGSQDSSGEICEEYAAKDSRIKVIHKQNEGLGFARNSGLEISTGKYVTFIDSDDVAECDLVEQLMKEVVDKDVDTCIGGFKRIAEDGKVVFQESYAREAFSGNDVYNKLFARMLGSAPDAHDAIRMSVWNVLYSMDIIRKHNIRFPSERVFISEDIVWDSEYYRYAQAVSVIGSTAYHYRITPGSLTQKYKPQMIDRICVLYNEMEKRVSADREKIIRLQRMFFVNLRVCIGQEKPLVSGNTWSECRKNIVDIFNNSTVRRVIESYPIQAIQFKQRLFLLMVKYRMANCAVWLNSLNIV